MALYLCVSNTKNNETKRYTGKENANAPYLKVDNAYFPLTTETTTAWGLRINSNNQVYRIIESYTTYLRTTKETTTFAASGELPFETFRSFSGYVSPRQGYTYEQPNNEIELPIPYFECSISSLGNKMIFSLMGNTEQFKGNLSIASNLRGSMFDILPLCSYSTIEGDIGDVYFINQSTTFSNSYDNNLFYEYSHTVKYFLPWYYPQQHYTETMELLDTMSTILINNQATSCRTVKGYAGEFNLHPAEAGGYPIEPYVYDYAKLGIIDNKEDFYETVITLNDLFTLSYKIQTRISFTANPFPSGKVTLDLHNLKKEIGQDGQYQFGRISLCPQFTKEYNCEVIAKYSSYTSEYEYWVKATIDGDRTITEEI